MAGFALWQLRVDFDGAVELYDRAIALNPSSAQALTLRGWSFASAGEPDEAIKLLEQARRLSPVDPEAFFTMSAMGFAYMSRRSSFAAVACLVASCGPLQRAYAGYMGKASRYGVGQIFLCLWYTA
jgi:tetratricopeptide (TPR) repeat protein